MELNKIILSEAGAKPARRRVGRGSASGYGRTAGRGHEGQRARGNIRVSHLIKQALKVRKIRKQAGINKILYPTYEITANALPQDLLLLIEKCTSSIEVLQAICQYYNMEYNPETLANELMEVFDIPHYIKRVKFIGLNFNIMLKI